MKFRFKNKIKKKHPSLFNNTLTCKLIIVIKFDYFSASFRHSKFKAQNKEASV